MSTPGNTQQNVIKIVEGHVEQLIADHKRLSERNRDLSEQCDKLRATKRELQQKVTALEKELSVVSLAEGLTTMGGAVSGNATVKSRQRARAYVNRLMREIDTCISCMTAPEAEAE